MLRIMMLLTKARNDVMFTDYAVKRKIIQEVNTPMKSIPFGVSRFCAALRHSGNCNVVKHTVSAVVDKKIEGVRANIQLYGLGGNSADTADVGRKHIGCTASNQNVLKEGENLCLVGNGAGKSFGMLLVRNKDIRNGLDGYALKIGGNDFLLYNDCAAIAAMRARGKAVGRIGRQNRFVSLGAMVLAQGRIGCSQNFVAVNTFLMHLSVNVTGTFHIDNPLAFRVRNFVARRGGTGNFLTALNAGNHNIHNATRGTGSRHALNIHRHWPMLVSAGRKRKHHSKRERNNNQRNMILHQELTENSKGVK